MTKLERKAAMVLAGATQANIARATEFSDAYVHDVISGNRRNDVIERAIANAIGRPVDEVFGAVVAA